MTTQKIIDEFIQKILHSDIINKQISLDIFISDNYIEEEDGKEELHFNIHNTKYSV